MVFANYIAISTETAPRFTPHVVGGRTPHVGDLRTVASSISGSRMQKSTSVGGVDNPDPYLLSMRRSKDRASAGHTVAEVNLEYQTGGSDP